MSNSKRPRAREQGISFNGAAGDSDDAKWYFDPPPENPITPMSAISLSATPAISSSVVQESSNSSHATKRRRLERFTSAEVTDAYINESIPDEASSH